MNFRKFGQLANLSDILLKFEMPSSAAVPLTSRIGEVSMSRAKGFLFLAGAGVEIDGSAKFAVVVKFLTMKMQNFINISNIGLGKHY